MIKKIIVLDEETATLLEGKPNKSKYIREAIKYMSMDISPDTIDGLRKSYLALTRQLKEIDSKIDYISRKVQ